MAVVLNLTVLTITTVCHTAAVANNCLGKIKRIWPRVRQRKKTQFERGEYMQMNPTLKPCEGKRKSKKSFF